MVYSDKYLPGEYENFECASDYTGIRDRYFDENKFLNSLVGKDEFKIFSNSFLISIRK